MRRHAAATLAATDVRFYARHQAEVNCCALSRDCRSVLTCSDDGRLYLWDAGSAELLAELSGHAGPVKTCAVSPCGHLCASGSLDATVRIWDAAAAPVTCLRVLTGHKKSVETVSFSPDSRWLVSGSWDQSAVVWEVQTGQAFRELRGHTGAIQSSAFAEDSQYVATGAWDYMVKVWNLLVEDEVVTLEGHSGNIASVCFSVVGMLASGSWDSSVRVWLPEKGVCLFVLTGPTRAWVRSLAFSRDGLVLASAAEGDLVSVVDVLRCNNFAATSSFPKRLPSCRSGFGTCQTANVLTAYRDIRTLRTGASSLQVALCSRVVLRSGTDTQQTGHAAYE